MHQRQHTGYRAILLSEDVTRAMAKGFFDELTPTGAMKKGA